MKALGLLAVAAEAPDAVGLWVDGRPLTFGELGHRVRGAIDALEALGLDAADRTSRVALVPRRDLRSFVLLHALIELGVPVLPLHPRATREEHERLEDLGRPTLRVPGELVLAPEGRPRPPSAVPADSGALAILFTSGTTGTPKGAVLSRAAFAASARASAENLGWRPDDRWMLCMPPAHVGGLSILVRCLLGRRAVVLADGVGFGPDDIAAQIERDGVTLLSLVPTMLARLLEASFTPAPKLRAVLLGGAATSGPLLRRAADRGVPVLTTYGLTEACSQVTTQPLGTTNRGDLGSGKCVAGTELRIREGLIEVRGPTLMSGYLDAPSPLTADGWLPTGDYGNLDGEGQLHVRGRRHDLIVTGGENVYPAQLEAELVMVDGVLDACVFGREDETWGQLVAVALVLASDAGARPRVEAAMARLASHRRPRAVAYVAELPRGRGGKLDRRRVVSEFEYFLVGPEREMLPP